MSPAGHHASTPSAAEWRRFLSRALALLGAALLVAAAVCFVAANWDRMGRLGRFALAEIAIVASAALAWKRLPSLTGEVALFVAAALVGPLLAVYGQTYQTGADPYGLFLGWFVLTLPWVLASRLVVLWLMALALLDISLALWWTQVLGPTRGWLLYALPLVIAALHAGAVAAWEWQARRASPWLTGRWAWYVVLASGFVALTSVAVAAIFDHTPNVSGVLGVLGLAAAVAGAVRYHRRVRRDRLVVTVAVTAAMVWFAMLAGRVVFDVLHLHESGLVLLAGFVVWEIAVGVRWHRRSRPATDDGYSENADQADEADTADKATRAAGTGSSVRDDADDTEMPWYVRTVVAVGVWVATVLLLFFFGAVLRIHGDVARMVIGAGLIVVAVWMRRGQRSDALRHAAIALSFAGQGVALAALQSAQGSFAVTAVAGLVLSAVLIVAVPDRVHRLLSGVVLGGFAFGLAWNLRVRLLPDVVAVALAVLVVVLWSERRRRGLRARVAAIAAGARYGIVISLFGALAVSTATPFAHGVHDLAAHTPVPLGALTTAGVTLVLLVLAWHILEDLDRIGTMVAFAVLGGIAALGASTLPAPGIITGIAVLVLAFRHRDRVLMGCAVVFLLVFAPAFYASLALTLLSKSGVLAGSGVLLLAVRSRIAPDDSGDESFVAEAS